MKDYGCVCECPSARGIEEIHFIDEDPVSVHLLEFPWMV